MPSEVLSKKPRQIEFCMSSLGIGIPRCSSKTSLYVLSIICRHLLADLGQTGQKELLFDATHAKPTPLKTRPLEEMEDRESQKLWNVVTAALKNRDQNVATAEKTRIEDEQRQEASRRADEGVDWRPRLFREVQGGPGGPEEGEEDLDWIVKANVYVVPPEMNACANFVRDGKTAEEQIKQILNFAAILPGQTPQQRFSIPSRKSGLSRQSTLTETPETAQEGSAKSTQIADPANPSSASSAGQAPSANLIDVNASSAPHGQPTGGDDKGALNDLAGLTIGSSSKQHASANEHRQLESNAASAPSQHPGSGLPPTTVRREDSQTHVVDEFVDAES